MIWNSRSKLKIAQCFKQTDTYNISVHSQKKKKSFKLYPEGYLMEWLMMHLFSWESPSMDLNFLLSTSNFGCGCFPGKAQPP
jgi:hypothetical protein